MGFLRAEPRRARTPTVAAAAVILAAGCASQTDAPAPAAGPGPATGPSVPAPHRPEPPPPQGAPTAQQDAQTAATPPMVAGDVGVTAESAALRREHSLAIEAMEVCCPGPMPGYFPQDRERYGHFDDNPLKLAREQPVSTFSIDVDTGAYANVRRFLDAGSLPPEDAVRVEELINYFTYDYPEPPAGQPFSVDTAVARAPWNPEKLLLRVGIRGYEVPVERRAPANLVFLVDVSGSMQPEDKLPLLKRSLRLLVRQMRATDRVSLVVYAGAAGAVLSPTPGDRQGEILAALDRLEAGGSTNGGDGIRLAYDFARQARIPGGINRVLLATDGDFNVGTVDFEALLDLVERERAGGVSLTTLGFGTGNYNDHLLERLADAGNGNYAYVDKLSEGRKVLVEQLSGTLQTIARDVKIQVEFNPARVAEYRLIGYENRQLRREDFNNDRVDAGEIGAGHTVTALYELTPVGSPAALIEPLRYADRPEPAARGDGELAHVRLRYQPPEGGASRLIEQPVRATEVRGIDQAPADLRFAAAVAAFGQRLRGGEYLADYDWNSIAKLAAGARGEDADGYRSEFLSLVRLADSLSAESAPHVGAND
jgi:Ca-activated chloride channel family protein